jgi:hypothetical protein
MAVTANSSPITPETKMNGTFAWRCLSSASASKPLNSRSAKSEITKSGGVSSAAR